MSSSNYANLFPRGGTWSDGGTVGIPDNIEGQTIEYEDKDFSVTGPIKTTRSNRPVKCMVVKNASGGALLPKLRAKMKTDGSGNEFLGQVSGYAGVGEHGYPIDEFLPAAGVPNGDLFLVVVEGPATITAQDTTLTIAIGDIIVPATSGYVKELDTAATGTTIYTQLANAVGRAITAKTAATQGDVLVEVGAVS